MTTQPIPILLVTGFLGAGKTTFINWLIHALPDKKISLILNEFGDIKLESQFIEKQGIGLVTELANGCMCCVAKSDIPRVIRYTLDNSPATETILIEASGLSDPDPVRDVLQAGDLTSIVRLDTVVCVVDALNFARDKESHPIIMSQIGDADIILISKSNELSSEDKASLVSTISNIGIGTKVLVWDDNLNPSIFLDPRIEQKLITKATHEHVHEQVDEFWYISDNALNPQLLHQTFASLPSSIIRAKGYSMGDGDKLLIQFVGSKLALSYGENETESGQRTAILFLGNHLDSDVIKSKLDDCRII